MKFSMFVIGQIPHVNVTWFRLLVMASLILVLKHVLRTIEPSFCFWAYKRRLINSQMISPLIDAGHILHHEVLRGSSTL